jgi:hypothetical protein
MAANGCCFLDQASPPGSLKSRRDYNNFSFNKQNGKQVAHSRQGDNEGSQGKELRRRTEDGEEDLQEGQDVGRL